ncbi:MAG: hypothetical protein MUF45_06130 [Spirosomaceae bacterium]|jgi:hypothetical protein|nr:hypothetical protein [Spirosomataceae bacterium]
MRGIFIGLIISFLYSCKPQEISPRNCRFVTVKEEQVNLTGAGFTAVSTFTYNQNGDLEKMEVNNSNTANSYTINIKHETAKRKVLENIQASGRVSRDTLTLNDLGYRDNNVFRNLNSFSKTFYEYDSKGFPRRVVLKDNFGNGITLGEWEYLNDGSNLTIYQRITANGIVIIEQYEYYPDKINDRFYYVSQFHLSKVFGRPPRNILKKILRANGDKFEYTDYQFDKNNNITSYVETFTGISGLNGYTRKVSFEYFCVD